MQIAFVKDEKAVASLDADQKAFKSGSIGYWAGGKVNLNGKRYQVSCSIVEVGSKPKAE